MKKTMRVLALLFVVMMVSTAAFADASPWTEGDTYSEQVKGKLDYGLKNLLGGWTDIVTKGLASGGDGFPECFTGLLMGIKDAVVNTVGGAVHTATFFVPVDVPIPGGGVDL